MTCRLLLLRHAKSARSEGVADRDRPLAERGRKDARFMGALMAHESLVPDIALVSPARRTRETWALARGAFSSVIPESDVASLYDSTPDRLLNAIRAVGTEAKTIVLIGHNPEMQETAALLCGDGKADAMVRLDAKFPTAGLAVIDFAVANWAQIEPNSGYLERFVTPKPA
jgi:phosphohistidine phosphatase